jgi:CxxC motif-containing protein (DUF1111 family)
MDWSAILRGCSVAGLALLAAHAALSDTLAADPLANLLGLPGGSATVSPDTPTRAFATATDRLEGLAALDAAAGEGLFARFWVSSPASTRAADGLGPLYNARACSSCHVNHGRGHPPDEGGAPGVAMTLRLAGPDGAPDPVLGQQVQHFAVAGLQAEAQAHLDWREFPVTLGDGTVLHLREPVVALNQFGYGPPAPDSALGARIAPPLVGMGLIDQIDPADILANEGRAGGRARMVAEPVAYGGQDGAGAMVARFGRRAGSVSLAHSTAAALSVDIGISTPLFPDPWGDCTAAQSACRAAPHGDGDTRVHEVSTTGLDLIVQHLASLGVPRPVQADDVAQGREIFTQAGCAACHRPSYQIDTPDGPDTIWPYSDFLLHDMGPGLASRAPEAGLTPGEWRTQPLWGLGWTRTVGEGRESYLHDGRARSVLEAILWHGGAAQAARDHVAALPQDDRAALIRFLESL